MEKKRFNQQDRGANTELDGSVNNDGIGAGLDELERIKQGLFQKNELDMTKMPEEVSQAFEDSHEELSLLFSQKSVMDGQKIIEAKNRLLGNLALCINKHATKFLEQRE